MRHATMTALALAALLTTTAAEAAVIQISSTQEQSVLLPTYGATSGRLQGSLGGSFSVLPGALTSTITVLPQIVFDPLGADASAVDLAPITFTYPPGSTLPGDFAVNVDLTLSLSGFTGFELRPDYRLTVTGDAGYIPGGAGFAGTLTTTDVPEPGTLAVVGMGIAGLALTAR